MKRAPTYVVQLNGTPSVANPLSDGVVSSEMPHSGLVDLIPVGPNESDDLRDSEEAVDLSRNMEVDEVVDMIHNPVVGHRVILLLNPPSPLLFQDGETASNARLRWLASRKRRGDIFRRHFDKGAFVAIPRQTAMDNCQFWPFIARTL